MPKSLEQFSITGLPLHLSDDYCSWLFSRLENSRGSHVVTLNAEMVIQAEQNQHLADIIRNAELVIPDGAGIILYLLLRHQRQFKRCPGIELAETLLKQSTNKTYSVFFYGGKPEVALRSAYNLQQKMPNLNIVGTEHGYISPQQQAELKIKLQQLQPQLIFVGLGVPRQEYWIAENRHLCPNAIWIGVGGSLDIWAGIKTRAPAWLRNNYLEWLYRLYQEPWRWKRMLALPLFAWKVLSRG
jgi:N-acetylglucosaminyldiphosphoundecaprenol N-acetyl-beta-D-mannosaminyltransferase